MKRLYVAILFFLVILISTLISYFFGDQIMRVVPQDWSQQNLKEIQTNPSDAPSLSKEEQKEILDDLLPQDVVDTEQEFNEQIKLLEELQEVASQNSDIDLLNQLQNQVSTEEQLRQLESLQN